MKLFDLDSKFMYYANKFADLMWLNILTLVCCIPIFTIGASLTAMHRMLLAIYHDEESYITRGFFKSFKENFKQSTIIWIIYFAIIGILAADFWFIFKGGLELHNMIKYALGFVSLMVAFSFSWVFVLQSRYENKVFRTIQNSIVVGTSHFFYSIMMILLSAMPILALVLWEMSVPFVILFGFTVPGILKTMLYSRVFDRMEGVDRKAPKNEDDGWSVEVEEATENGTNVIENGQVDGEN